MLDSKVFCIIKSPVKSSREQALLLYGANFNTNFYKSFEKYKHILEPYIQYQGITKPTAKIDTYYVFSIEDGYNKLNLIKTGNKKSVIFFKRRKIISNI